MGIFKKLLKNGKGDTIIPVVDRYKWVPDYSRMSDTNLWGNSVTTNIENDGFVYVWGNYYLVNANCEVHIRVNNKIIMSEATEARGPNSAVVCNASGVIPVSAGDVVSITYSSGASPNRRICQFIPGKWQFGGYSTDPAIDTNAYSTSEMLTGKTWIDGKPIYRRVFTGTANNAANSRTNVELWVSSPIEAIVDAGGWCGYSTNGKNHALMSESNSDWRGVYVQNASGNLVYAIQATSAQNNRPYQVWVEYTKR